MYEDALGSVLYELWTERGWKLAAVVLNPSYVDTSRHRLTR